MTGAGTVPCRWLWSWWISGNIAYILAAQSSIGIHWNNIGSEGLALDLPTGWTTRSRRTGAVWLMTALLLGAATDAAAVCTTCYEWNVATSELGTTTTPTYANGLVAHASGGVIYLHRPGIADGSVAGTYDSSSDIRRSPALTELPDPQPGHWYVFATLTRGYLVKLDVPDPVPVVGTVTLEVAKTANVAQTRDLRRGACPTDSLLAEPVVQRRVDSNAQFTLDKDIVMVATAHECSDTTGNLIIALDAADVTQPALWAFNTGEAEIGRIRACLLDLARNRLDCVAEHPSNSCQPSVFSIDTVTGTLMWSAIGDIGVHVRPALGAPGGPGAGHLYVGDQLGRVTSFDAGEGTPHGSVFLVNPADGGPEAINVDINVGSGAYAGMVYGVSKSKIAALYDDGADLNSVWVSSVVGGQPVISQAVPVESLGKLYAGTSDGNFRQFSLADISGLASGSDEASGSIVLALSQSAFGFVIGLYQGSDGFYRLVGTAFSADAGQVTKQYRVPCEFLSEKCVPEFFFMDGFEE